jgi:hypothetical protein
MHEVDQVPQHTNHLFEILVASLNLDGLEFYTLEIQGVCWILYFSIVAVLTAVIVLKEIPTH